jgi:hypothetical protein
MQSALLVFQVEARDARDNALDWVASVQCTDNRALAYQLGYLIGGAIGKRRDNAPV